MGHVSTGTRPDRFFRKTELMIKIIVHLQNVAADRRERGAAMAEYGLLLALVALAAIIVLAAFGQSIKGVFTSAQTQLDAGIPAAP